MSRHESKTDWLPILLPAVFLIVFALLVALVSWGNSIGYHGPTGRGRYSTPSPGYFTDPPSRK